MENVRKHRDKPVYKPVYLGLPILEISKTLMHEFWFDYIKPKYRDNVIYH